MATIDFKAVEERLKKRPKKEDKDSSEEVVGNNEDDKVEKKLEKEIKNIKTDMDTIFNLRSESKTDWTDVEHVVSVFETVASQVQDLSHKPSKKVLNRWLRIFNLVLMRTLKKFKALQTEEGETQEWNKLIERCLKIANEKIGGIVPVLKENEVKLPEQKFLPERYYTKQAVEWGKEIWDKVHPLVKTIF